MVVKDIKDKVLRFAFCVFRSCVTVGDSEQIVFDEAVPNSVRKNRLLLEFIAGENDKAAATVCITPLLKISTSFPVINGG